MTVDTMMLSFWIADKTKKKGEKEEKEKKMADEPLKDLLDCPVCLDEYKDPKILPCHHSFCRTCLEAVPIKQVPTGSLIGCPTCREPCTLPKGGIQSLPPSFLLNNLLEMRRKPSVKVERKSFLYSEDASTCPVHSKPLDMYCNNCDTLICHHGVAKRHRGHVCDIAEEVYDKYMMPVHQSLTGIEDHLLRMDGIIEKITMTKSDVHEKCERVKRLVNEAAQSMVRKVELEQKILLEQINQTSKVKSDEIQRKEKKAKQVKHTLKEGCETVSQFLQDHSKLESMACKDKLLNHLATVEKEDKVDHLMELGEKLEIEYQREQQPEVISLGKITTNLPALRRHRASTMRRKKTPIDPTIFEVHVQYIHVHLANVGLFESNFALYIHCEVVLTLNRTIR